MTHPAPPRPRWPLVVAMAVVLVAVLIGATVFLLGGQGSPDRVEPGPGEATVPATTDERPPPPTPTREATTAAPSTATPTAEPEPDGGGADPTLTPGKPRTGFRGQGMEQTRLYNVMWANGSAACSALPGGLPEPPLPDDQLAVHLSEIVDCLMEVHRPLLAAEGLDLTEPKIVTYAESQATPCGTLTNENPAYYCSGDRTIYVRADSDEDPDGYARSSMGYWILISHEFGHHLQAVSGIFADYAKVTEGASREEQLELSRRLELQATCFSGVFLGAARENLTYDDNYTATRNFYLFNSDDQSGVRSHGTGETQVAWFDRGYLMEWNAFARCNTWSAEADEVA